jgi:hypothetical protein
MADISHILSQPEAMTALKKTRFPMSFIGDQNFKAKAESWSWPRGVQAQPQRRGDNLGMEFRFFAKNREELVKTLKALEHSSEPWT